MGIRETIEGMVSMIFDLTYELSLHCRLELPSTLFALSLGSQMMHLPGGYNHKIKLSSSIFIQLPAPVFSKSCAPRGFLATGIYILTVPRLLCSFPFPPARPAA